jgi:hypothetical protein
MAALRNDRLVPSPALAVALGIGAIAMSEACAQPASDPRIEAFRAACVPDRQSSWATEFRATKEGWTKVEDDDNPELDDLMRISRGQLNAPDATVVNQYRKELASGPAYLVVMSSLVGAVSTVSCHLYDFEAAEPIDLKAIVAWLGKQPSEVGGAPREGFMQKWVGLDILPGSDVYAGFIPADSPVIPNTGFGGVALRINSVEK